MLGGNHAIKIMRHAVLSVMGHLRDITTQHGRIGHLQKILLPFHAQISQKQYVPSGEMHLPNHRGGIDFGSIIFKISRITQHVGRHAAQIHRITRMNDFHGNLTVLDLLAKTLHIFHRAAAFQTSEPFRGRKIVANPIDLQIKIGNILKHPKETSDMVLVAVGEHPRMDATAPLFQLFIQKRAVLRGVIAPVQHRHVSRGRIDNITHILAFRPMSNLHQLTAAKTEIHFKKFHVRFLRKNAFGPVETRTQFTIFR